MRVTFYLWAEKFTLDRPHQKKDEHKLFGLSENKMNLKEASCVLKKSRNRKSTSNSKHTIIMYFVIVANGSISQLIDVCIINSLSLMG